MRASRAAAWGVPLAVVLLAAFFVPKQRSHPGRDIEWTDASKSWWADELDWWFGDQFGEPGNPF